MNEELIRECAREGAASEYEALGLIGMASNFLSGAMDDATDVRSAELAIRLYHARAVAPLVEALRAVTPITVHNTSDYAGLTFGTSQTQAMTMEPQKWEAVNAALAAFQQEAKHDQL